MYFNLLSSFIFCTSNYIEGRRFHQNKACSNPSTTSFHIETLTIYEFSDSSIFHTCSYYPLLQHMMWLSYKDWLNVSHTANDTIDDNFIRMITIVFLNSSLSTTNPAVIVPMLDFASFLIFNIFITVDLALLFIFLSLLFFLSRSRLHNGVFLFGDAKLSRQQALKSVYDQLRHHSRQLKKS